MFNAAEAAVSELLSAEAWDDVLETAGLDGSYTALGSYDDHEMERIVAAAASTTGWTEDEVLEAVGRKAYRFLAQRYTDLLDDVGSTIELLQALNTVVHPEVVKLYPDARPPTFAIHVVDGSCASVEYQSSRRLSHLAVGLLHGAADQFGETIVIDELVVGADGATFDLQIVSAPTAAGSGNGNHG